MEPFKTVLPAAIASQSDAETFLKALYENGEDFHPEDSARTIVWHNSAPTPAQADQLNKLMGDIHALKNFDPCEYLLMLSGRVLVKNTFEIEGFKPVEGYHNPHLFWNGWERPLFEKQAVETALNDMGIKWTYNPEADQFLISGDWSELETVEGEIVETEHGPKKLYPLGTCSWVWELAEIDNK